MLPTKRSKDETSISLGGPDFICRVAGDDSLGDLMDRISVKFPKSSCAPVCLAMCLASVSCCNE